MRICSAAGRAFAVVGGEMTRKTTLENSYFRWRNFMVKRGIKPWASVGGRKVISRVTASLAGVAGIPMLLAAVTDWQIRRLDVNLIPDMEESSHVYDLTQTQFAGRLSKVAL